MPLASISVDDGGAELVERVGQRHAVDLGGIEQALHVLRQAEDRRALRLGVAADALEDAGAVVNHVAHHVDGGLFPRNEVAVMPDFRGGLDGHESGESSFESRRCADIQGYRESGSRVTRANA